MDKNYWNKLSSNFQDNVLEISNKDLFGILKKEIRKLANLNLIAADLGCGQGSLLPLIAPKFKKVYASDYAKDLLATAKKRNSFKNIEYIQHNLTLSKAFPKKADVTFNINTLLNPDIKIRKKIISSVYKATKKGGRSLFVVPSFESVLNTYHALLKCKTSLKELEKSYKEEIISSVQGIVNIGGTLTKCHTKEEISTLLNEIGYTIESAQKIEFSWEEEIDNPPKWLQKPYPWDWMIRARK